MGVGVCVCVVCSVCVVCMCDVLLYDTLGVNNNCCMYTGQGFV